MDGPDLVFVVVVSDYVELAVSRKSGVVIFRELDSLVICELECLSVLMEYKRDCEFLVICYFRDVDVLHCRILTCREERAHVRDRVDVVRSESLDITFCTCLQVGCLTCLVPVAWYRVSGCSYAVYLDVTDRISFLKRLADELYADLGS